MCELTSHTDIDTLPDAFLLITCAQIPFCFGCNTNFFLQYLQHWHCQHDPAVDSEQFRRDLKTYLFTGDIRSVSTLEVLRNRALQIDHLLTWLLKLRIHDATGCTTGWSNRKMSVYTIQPVVQRVASCIRGFNAKYTFKGRFPTNHFRTDRYALQLRRWQFSHNETLCQTFFNRFAIFSPIGGGLMDNACDFQPHWGGAYGQRTMFILGSLEST